MGGGARGGRASYGPSGSNSNGDLTTYSSSTEGKKRAFISFHVDDEAQVNLLRHQARDEDSDLEFVDYSVKEPFDEAWKTQCTTRIQQSSCVVVMVGPETHTREAVLWEINKAYELGKPVIGVRVYRDENHTVPEPMVENGARIINWDLQTLQNEIEE